MRGVIKLRDLDEFSNDRHRLAEYRCFCGKEFKNERSRVDLGHIQSCGCLSAKKNPLERFWDKVDKNGPVPSSRPDLGKCWVWVGAIGKWGYGNFWDGDNYARAHSFSYQLVRGSVTHELDHLCRNRACVNPDHLEDVPHSVNVRRGESPSAHQARQTHCKRGHEFTTENTYIWGKKYERHCRECQRARRRGELTA